MTVISRHLFNERVGKELTCGSLHYWTKSCAKTEIWLAYQVFLGSLKFFLPVYIVKAILNHKKLKDPKFIRQLVLEEIRSGVYGLVMANLLFGTNCVLYHTTGRVRYWNLGFISGIVSGLGLLVESKENKMLDTLIFFNLLIEAIFTNLKFFNMANLSRTKETLLFMAVSGILMHIFQNRKKPVRFTHLWFYTPQMLNHGDSKDTKQKLNHKCSHKLSCENFALKGIRKYFLLGYLFSIVRNFIPRMFDVPKNPKLLLSILVNKDNVKFGTFIGSYVAIYQYTMCYLLKYHDFPEKYFGALSGVLAGTTYAISPNLQVLNVGITTICQILYHKMLKQLNVQNRILPQQIVYMLCHGLLLHNAIFCKETCPSYYFNMLNNCTNGVFGKIYKNVITDNFP